MKSKTIKEQIEDEKKFFQSNDMYKKIANKMGIPYLIKSLNLHFTNHIKKSLPTIRDNLIKLILVYYIFYFLFLYYFKL